MARMCGVCGQAPREGQEMFPIRLDGDDIITVKEELAEGGREIRHDESGLYSACLECTESHRKRVAVKMAEEQGKDISEINVPNNALC